MIPECIERLISKANMTEATIAAEVECDQSTINRLRRGQVPHFDLGKRIIELHDRTFPPSPKRRRRRVST